MVQFETLVTSSVWRANPWDYNSVIYLQFRSDSSGKLTFGYGQTIYAIIKCRFALTEASEMTLFYLDSPAYQWFKGFKPSPGHESRILQYSLVQRTVEGIEPYEDRVRYLWTLTLDGSPFPEGLTLPLDVPREYYGYREEL